MAEDIRDSPDKIGAEKKSQFAEMAKMLYASFVPREVKPPQIRASCLEFYARRMSERGYEMTENTLQILCEYLKGYNIWLCGNVGVGKTFFFETMSSVRRSRNLSLIHI